MLVIAIPLTGISYGLAAGLLSFLPGGNWENFAGFFITLVVFSVIGHAVLFIPGKIVQGIWSKGVLYRLTGGVLNVLNAGIGLVVFTLVLLAYPIFGWLERAVAGSSVLASLVRTFDFVQDMLPAVFQRLPVMV